MLRGVLTQQQPNDAALAQDAAAAAADTDAGDGLQEGTSLSQALAGQGFTQQQQEIVQQLLQQQQQQQEQEQHAFVDSEDAYSDVGTEMSLQDAGEYVSMEDEGVYADAADAAHGHAAEQRQGTAEWYRNNLTEPLWQAGEATSNLRIHQAIFMLMAWKADHCVRDNAFAELLGMLSMLFLPEVSHGVWTVSCSG
jgi:hypothetical protein